jgi:predicted DNA-binding protein
MEVHFTPEIEKKLNDLSADTGRPVHELLEDILAEYIHELAGVRHSLDSRYDEIKSGRVKLIDGETFFDELREREEALLQNLQPL